MEKSESMVLAPAAVGAMVRVPDVFEPTTMDEAMWLSKTLHAGGLLPGTVRSWEAAFTIIVIGHELGLSPMASLRSIYYFDGKTVLAAALMAGICQKRTSVCEYFMMVEASDQTVTYETKRKGHPAPTRMTWTHQMAQDAKLVTKDVWVKYRRSMLIARCQADLCRAVYPDIVGGMYDPDEIEHSASARIPTLGASVGASIMAERSAPAAEEAPVVRGPELVKDVTDRLAAAATPKDVAAVAEAISLADRKGLLSPDEKAGLTELWKARRKALRDARAAEEAAKEAAVKAATFTPPAETPATPPAPKSEPASKPAATWNPNEQDAPPPSERRIREPGEEG